MMKLIVGIFALALSGYFIFWKFGLGIVFPYVLEQAKPLGSLAVPVAWVAVLAVGVPPVALLLRGIEDWFRDDKSG
jgi:hypothetical protein